MNPTWPAVERRVVSWSTNPDQVDLRGARPPREDRLLTEIIAEIPAEISPLTPNLNSETVLICEEAAAAIARLDTKGVALSGASEFLVRTEAVASSRIEHIYADLEEIAKAALGESAGENARLTIGAARAMGSLTERVQDEGINEQILCEAHRELLAADFLEGSNAGCYRTVQNWIGGSNYSPRGAVHIPPPPADVPGLMHDLMAFANRTDLSAIAQAAIVHAQFESIHPFTDGNGRLGRALIGAVLRQRGLTTVVTVPIAAAMLSNVDDYFEQLAKYRAGDVNSFVRYLGTATLASARAAETSADYLATLPQMWRELVSPRAGSAAESLINSLLQNPTMNLATAVSVTMVTPAKALAAIDRLVDEGVLREITHGARNRIWVTGAVMDELAEIEQKIGLRSVPSRKWRRI